MYKILFVDDDIALRNVVSEYFNERQYDIICTASAAKTIDYLKSTSIDCVILDVDLPDSNGFELCTSIRQFSSVPIIFLSCYTENDDRIKGFLSGGDDYVSKPFSLKELELRINVRIRRRYENQPPELLKFGELTIDTGRLMVIYHGMEYAFPVWNSIFLPFLHAIRTSFLPMSSFMIIYGSSPSMKAAITFRPALARSGKSCVTSARKRSISVQYVTKVTCSFRDRSRQCIRPAPVGSFSSPAAEKSIPCKYRSQNDAYRTKAHKNLSFSFHAVLSEAFARPDILRQFRRPGCCSFF